TTPTMSSTTTRTSARGRVMVAGRRGPPQSLVVDHGPEFISRALDRRAYRLGVELGFIRPGQPVENAYVESFPSRFRDECLSAHWFETLPDARWHIERWHQDSNEVRPHTSLAGRTPAESLETLKGNAPITRLTA
ncbi:MAG: integrase core domain-containing protein, partial [Gemmataceae bacterium]|nr:integrase core domain-containing protein [Gemmataceae bacterium]